MSDQKIMGRNMLREYDIKGGIFEDIFTTQERFGSKFCNFKQHRESYTDDTDEWLRTFVDCTLDECSEVLNWTKWKHWKNYDKFETNELELRFELIDILHFLVSQALLVAPPEYGSSWFNIVSWRDTIIWTDRYLESIYSSLKETYDIEDKDRVTKLLLRKLHMHAVEVYIVTSYRDQSKLVDIRTAIHAQFDCLINLMVLWGMSAMDIYNYYMSKNQENFDRQTRGY